MPGIILSLPGTNTIPSKQWAIAIVSRLSAISSREAKRVFHTLVAHGDTVAYANRAELDRRTARHTDTALICSTTCQGDYVPVISFLRVIYTYNRAPQLLVLCSHIAFSSDRWGRARRCCDRITSREYISPFIFERIFSILPRYAVYKSFSCCVDNNKYMQSTRQICKPHNELFYCCVLI